MKKRYKREKFLLHTLPVLNSLQQIMELKSLLRQGWLEHGIPEHQCESVADHSFNTAMSAWLIALQFFPELDMQKVLSIALAHELGEIYAGDITPDQNITANEKHRLELESLIKVMGTYPKRSIIVDCWLEFEAGTSPEARFVKQIDRFEMSLQAMQYHKLTGTDLSDFIKCTKYALKDERLQKLLEEMTSKQC